MDYYEIFSVISLPLGVFLLLLLICRPLILWYFRIPDMIERQDELIKELKIQNEFSKKQISPMDPKPVEDKNSIAESQNAVAAERKMSFTELRYGKN